MDSRTDRFGRYAAGAWRIARSPRLWVDQARYLIRGPEGPPADPWPVTPDSPWDPPTWLERTADAWCNICRWHGPAFSGTHHVESQLCPVCRSCARERFLFLGFVTRSPAAHYRVLETSPRLGLGYREAMRAWFDHLASDFDERSHRGMLKLDLQDIDLPTGSLDVILSAHVLEHVPDTDRALAELHRVLQPGGRLYLQVPVLQGVTTPPEHPEFHEDDTPVLWRFGLDLTARLRDHGFDTTLLCLPALTEAVASGATSWPEPTSTEFDVDALLAAADPRDLTPLVDHETALRLGLTHAYQFLEWECVRSPTS